MSGIGLYKMVWLGLSTLKARDLQRVRVSGAAATFHIFTCYAPRIYSLNGDREKTRTLSFFFFFFRLLGSFQQFFCFGVGCSPSLFALLQKTVQFALI